MMKWDSEADDPFEIKQLMFGMLSWFHFLIKLVSDQSLPDHLPAYTTMRILFSCFLDFRAVPQQPFF